MVFVWCFWITCTVALLAVGVALIVGRRRFAEKLGAARGGQSIPLSAGGVAGLGALTVAVAIVPLAAVLLGVVHIDHAAMQWDAISNYKGALPRILSVALLVLAAVSFTIGLFLFRKSWAQRETWDQRENGAIVVPGRLVTGSVLMALGVLAVPAIVALALSWL